MTTARYYGLLGGVALIGVAIVGWSVGSRAMAKTAVRPAAQPPAAAAPADPAKLMELARPVTKGDPKAPFTIVEFADFQCPYCAEFFRQVEPAIQSEFLATGKANFVFYDFPLTTIHPNAFIAARAARCAEDQTTFWAYHDILYGNQERWVGLPDPSGLLADFAQDLGLDRAAFEGCLQSGQHTDVVTAGMQLAGQLQVPGTPTLMVTRGRGMGRRVDGSIESIRAAIAAMQSGG